MRVLIAILNIIFNSFHAIKGTLFILAVTASFIYGYGIAHSEVATECKKLNAFYVGDTVYECKVKG